ncbi:hypothetical protein JXA32_07190 [Candidatus Sumerlaeota bacterium]|nr:hypothetical protein [Candidatus Sumerlaeota bacterium]
MSKEQKGLWLAWAGWRCRMPEDWRPVRIEGGWKNGLFVLSDAETPLLQIKWWRPGQKRFNAAGWIEKRLHKMKAGPQAGGAPHPTDFDSVAWAPGEPGVRGFWYGYCASADMMLELVISPEASKSQSRRIQRGMLESMRASGVDEPVKWAVYAASFETPPGFELAEKHLHLGDVSLLLTAPKNRRMMVRQVYPAELALERRKLDRWMMQKVYQQARKYKPHEDPQPWTLDLASSCAEGLVRRGRRRIAWPLGWIRPREAITAALHDADVNRLLIAEYEAPREADEAVLRSTLLAMNWAMRDDA